MLAGSLVAPEETVPEVDSEEITRLESEGTIWWQVYEERAIEIGKRRELLPIE